MKECMIIQRYIFNELGNYKLCIVVARFVNKFYLDFLKVFIYNKLLILKIKGVLYMYVIIDNGGKQEKVREGDIVNIDKINKKPGEKIELEGILFFEDKEPQDSGNTLKKAKVEAEILQEIKGQKVIIYKYKRRKNYNKKTGHRQVYSRVKITKIAI